MLVLLVSVGTPGSAYGRTKKRSELFQTEEAKVVWFRRGADTSEYTSRVLAQILASAFTLGSRASVRMIICGQSSTMYAGFASADSSGGEVPGTWAHFRHAPEARGAKAREVRAAQCATGKRYITAGPPPAPRAPWRNAIPARVPVAIRDATVKSSASYRRCRLLLPGAVPPGRKSASKPPLPNSRMSVGTPATCVAPKTVATCGWRSDRQSSTRFVRDQSGAAAPLWRPVGCDTVGEGPPPTASDPAPGAARFGGGERRAGGPEGPDEGPGGQAAARPAPRRALPVRLRRLCAGPRAQDPQPPRGVAERGGVEGHSRPPVEDLLQRLFRTAGRVVAGALGRRLAFAPAAAAGGEDGREHSRRQGGRRAVLRQPRGLEVRERHCEALRGGCERPRLSAPAGDCSGDATRHEEGHDAGAEDDDHGDGPSWERRRRRGGAGSVRELAGKPGAEQGKKMTCQPVDTGAGRLSVEVFFCG